MTDTGRTMNNILLPDEEILPSGSFFADFETDKLAFLE